MSGESELAEPNYSVTGSGPLCRPSTWPSLIALFVGVLGVVATHHGAASWGDPASGLSKILVSIAALLFLGAMGSGVVGLGRCSSSKERNVFCARPMRRVGVLLVLTTVGLVLSAKSQHLFRDLIARGQITAADVASMACVLAILGSAVAAVVALSHAQELSAAERNWGRSP